MISDDSPTRRTDADDRPTVRGLSAGRKVFGRYALESVLGRGGMGVVWRARDEELGEPVALKFLPDVVAGDDVAVEELRNETRHARRLTHSNIVRIHQFERDRATAAVSMEYVDGVTLSKLRLAQPGKVFTVEALAPLVRQLCAALEHAHGEARLVHRDLKPANILVTGEGVVKVTDFGIARSLSDTHTRLTGQIAGRSGTLLYMSPQQLVGRKATPADDIYALGATLYEQLTGQPPFYTGDVSHQILKQQPPGLAARREALGVTGAPVPRQWEETILACLAKEEQDRPPSALAVAERLGLATAGAGAKPGAPRAPAEAKPARRGRRLALLAGAVALVAVGGAAWWYFGHYRPEARRMAADAARQAEEKRLAAEQRAATEQAQAEAARNLRAEEQAQREALGWVSALPLTASDSELGAVAGKIDLYGRTAPAGRLDEVRRAFDQRRGAILAERERVRLANARGGLVVTTVPPGAEVTVGGLKAEKSPVTLRELKLGKCPVVVRLSGYEEQRLESDIKANDFATLVVTLVRSTGAAEVSSSPSGLAFVLAGQEKIVRGTTPAKLNDLPTGDYTLIVRRDGWPDQRKSVAVQRNQTTYAVVESTGGRLEITSTPSGAEVWAQGRRLGTTPLSLADLPPGSIDADLRLPGYQPTRTHADVRANETARAAVVLERARTPETAPPPAGFGPQETPEGETSGTRTIPGLYLTLVPISAGTFTMGSPGGERGRDPDEGPQTRVTLSRPFWLGRTEVTQAQWQTVMGTNPSRFRGDDRPVEQVSWNDAMAFCRRLTERELMAGRLPRGYVYTLPTEAQWEYACRAGTTASFGGDGDPRDMGWTTADSGVGTRPVGRKQPNAWGLYDMHGNVREWCQGWYGPYPGSSVTDYAGASPGDYRVCRGGGWRSAAQSCRSAKRSWGQPVSRDFDLGFRVALAPSP